MSLSKILVAGAASMLAGLAAVADEPSCVVTYSVDSAREIDVTSAVCDDESLETAAMVFAFARLEGPFREMLVMQAPVEVEFTFSEALIRAHAEGSGAI